MAGLFIRTELPSLLDVKTHSRNESTITQNRERPTVQKIIFASFLFLIFHAVGLATDINPALASVSITPDPIIVCEGETVTAKATVVPSDQYGRVTFEIDSQSTATVTPLTATSGVTTLTIKGLKAGKTTLSGFVDKVKKTTIAVNVIGFEIQVNHSVATDDDYVQIKDEICSQLFKTVSRAKVTGYPPSKVSVTLVNPDKRLGFPADSTLELDLPANGDWVNFEFTGQNKSKKIGDAKIVLHHGKANGPVCKEQSVTVFWFDNDSIEGASGNRYVYDKTKGKFQADPNPAITIRGHANIKPDSLNCSAPQIKDLVVGIVQNSTRASYIIKYINPQFKWTPLAVRGDKVSYFKELGLATLVTKKTLDNTPGDPNPVYDMTITNPPAPCGSGNTVIDDNPGYQSLPPSHQTLDLMSHGVVVAQVTYELEIRVDVDFMCWTVIYDKGTRDVVPLIRRGWQVNAVSSSNPGDRVSIDWFSHRSVCPETNAPALNSELQNSTNQKPVQGQEVTREK